MTYNLNNGAKELLLLASESSDKTLAALSDECPLLTARSLARVLTEEPYPGIAAEQTGRKAFLMELDMPYCDVIVQRWEKLTGKKAERLASAAA